MEFERNKSDFPENANFNLHRAGAKRATAAPRALESCLTGTTPHPTIEVAAIRPRLVNYEG